MSASLNTAPPSPSNAARPAGKDKQSKSTGASGNGTPAAKQSGKPAGTAGASASDAGGAGGAQGGGLDFLSLLALADVAMQSDAVATQDPLTMGSGDWLQSAARPDDIPGMTVSDIWLDGGAQRSPWLGADGAAPAAMGAAHAGVLADQGDGLMQDKAPSDKTSPRHRRVGELGAAALLAAQSARSGATQDAAQGVVNGQALAGMEALQGRGGGKEFSREMLALELLGAAALQANAEHTPGQEHAALAHRLTDAKTDPDYANRMPGADTLSLNQPGSGALGADGVVATAAVLDMSDSTQEQVVYWGNADVSQADVTLTGIDGAPLGVTVNMQGDEAQVAFRSDVPEVRAALEASNHDLRESLGALGLGLSGMSVGDFGADSQGRGQGRDRSELRAGERKGTVKVDLARTELTHSPLRRGGAAGGKSLDLYV